MPATLRILIPAILCLAGTVAHAQSTTQPITGSVYDGQPIRRSKPTAEGAEQAKPDPKSVDWTRLCAAMGIVIVLIMALRFAMLRLFPGARLGKTNGAVRVLSRTAIAPRQQVMLLQVGRRVVVVGDSGGTLSPLAQIEDPDEAAILIGQIETAAADATPAAASRFKAIFNRQQETYEEPTSMSSAAMSSSRLMDDDHPEPESIEPPPQEVANAQEEISSLISRMRSLTKTIRQ